MSYVKIYLNTKHHQTKCRQRLHPMVVVVVVVNVSASTRAAAAPPPLLPRSQFRLHVAKIQNGR